MDFFFGITLQCLTGRSFGLDKEKLRFYLVMVGLYYGMNVDYASLLWVGLSSYVKPSKKTTKISSARFWSLILHEVYSQAGIQVPGDVEVSRFSHLHIPKFDIDDPVIFHVVFLLLDGFPIQ